MARTRKNSSLPHGLRAEGAAASVSTSPSSASAALGHGRKEKAMVMCRGHWQSCYRLVGAKLKRLREWIKKLHQSGTKKRIGLLKYCWSIKFAIHILQPLEWFPSIWKSLIYHRQADVPLKYDGWPANPFFMRVPTKIATIAVSCPRWDISFEIQTRLEVKREDANGEI